MARLTGMEGIFKCGMMIHYDHFKTHNQNVLQKVLYEVRKCILCLILFPKWLCK
jgi:hypothetical protein